MEKKGRLVQNFEPLILAPLFDRIEMCSSRIYASKHLSFSFRICHKYKIHYKSVTANEKHRKIPVRREKLFHPLNKRVIDVCRFFHSLETLIWIFFRIFFAISSPFLCYECGSFILSLCMFNCLSPEKNPYQVFVVAFSLFRSYLFGNVKQWNNLFIVTNRIMYCANRRCN